MVRLFLVHPCQMFPSTAAHLLKEIRSGIRSRLEGQIQEFRVTRDTLHDVWPQAEQLADGYNLLDTNRRKRMDDLDQKATQELAGQTLCCWWGLLFTFLCVLGPEEPIWPSRHRRADGACFLDLPCATMTSADPWGAEIWPFY